MMHIPYSPVVWLVALDICYTCHRSLFPSNSGDPWTRPPDTPLCQHGDLQLWTFSTGNEAGTTQFYTNWHDNLLHECIFREFMKYSIWLQVALVILYCCLRFHCSLSLFYLQLLTNKAYMVLLVCFGSGIGVFTCFSTLLEQILCVKGYSNVRTQKRIYPHLPQTIKPTCAIIC